MAQLQGSKAAEGALQGIGSYEEGGPHGGQGHGPPGQMADAAPIQKAQERYKPWSLGALAQVGQVTVEKRWKTLENSHQSS